MLTEIISGIWIGDITDIYNEQFYKDNLINIVINCTTDQSFLDLPDITKLRIPLSSNMDINNDVYMLNSKLEKIISFIHSNLEDSNNILICCLEIKLIITSKIILENRNLKYCLILI